MNKSEKNKLSNLFGVFSAIFFLTFHSKIAEFFPFLNNVYVLIGLSLFIGVIFSSLVYSLIPTTGNKKKLKKQQSVNRRKTSLSPKNNKLSDTDLLKADIFTLEGTDFERLCFMYFADNGFNPEGTRASGDHGVDLIIKDPQDGLKIAVQCKRWKQSVGNGDLIKLQGGKDFYKCYSTFFITTSSYTATAREYAESVKMRIWNGMMVKNNIEKWQKEKFKKHVKI